MSTPSNSESLLTYSHFYLVGIKGVAMTSLAQCLSDARKNIAGCDVAEDYVTKDQLDKLKVKIDEGFENELSPEIDCLIYTAAHQGPDNDMVQTAQKKGIKVYSHAEALAELFNLKKGVAVCGVGGKSTTSAMISWILEKAGQNPSYSVGVGDIPGLDRTGRWNSESEYFVAEADEYVVDPKALEKGLEITPRFSFLNPAMIICTNLNFDHPDVYRDFDHTKQVFGDFFGKLSSGQPLIINGDDQNLVELAEKIQSNKVVSYGSNPGVGMRLTNVSSHQGKTSGQIEFENKSYTLELKLPGAFNLFNAMAALLASHFAGVPIEEGISLLKSFSSTLRRSQFIGTKNGVHYYDDYAHHPNEIKNIVEAFKQWYPQSRLVVAFQPHTFSRTKELFDEFVTALGTAKELVLIDIFASARESRDESVSCDLLAEKIKDKYPQNKVENLHTLERLTEFCKTELKAGDVMITLGAGDIYQIHDKI